MDARTGTQQTSSASGKPLRPLKPRKFRTSCDSCSASKVKCNQDTPQCLRCVNLGLRCNYSPSRRMGKPSASSRKLKTTTYSPSSSESEQSNSKPIKKAEFSPTTFFGDQQIQQVPLEHESSPLDPSLCHNNLMFMDWQDNIFPNLHPIETQLPATNLFERNFDIIPQLPNRDQFIFPEHSNLDSKRAPTQTPIYDPFPQIDQSPQISASPESIKASPKLYTHNLDFQDTYSPYPHPTNASIDQVLINSKSAIDNAYSLLSCTCSDNPQFALNIALICTKVLEMYEEIIEAFSTTCISPITGRRRSSSDAISITVGAYKMDAEDEERIRIQIVLIELRKVKGLVDAFATKYCSGAEGGKRSGDEIYLALERFLRSKLSVTLQDLVTRLES